MFYLSAALEPTKNNKNQIKSNKKNRERASKKKRPHETNAWNQQKEKKRIKTMKIKFKLTLVHIKNYYFRIILLADCRTLLLLLSLAECILFALHFCSYGMDVQCQQRIEYYFCNQNHKIWTGIRDLIIIVIIIIFDRFERMRERKRKRERESLNSRLNVMSAQKIELLTIIPGVPCKCMYVCVYV